METIARLPRAVRDQLPVFEQLVIHTCKQFPGIQRRCATLEGRFDDVRLWLTPRLPDEPELLDLLAFGETWAGPRISDEFSLLTAAMVARGAALLGPMEPDPGVDPLEEYLGWRNLYVEAEKRKEVLLLTVIG